MANYSAGAVTTLGQALIAKAQAGAAINFTRMQIGSGQLGGGDPAARTALINPIAYFNINAITHLENTANVMGIFENTGLSTSTYTCEIGLFAQDPDAGEILYAYANAEDQGDTFPPASSGPYSLQFKLNAAVGNAVNVTATVPSDAYIPWSDADVDPSAGSVPRRTAGGQIKSAAPAAAADVARLTEVQAPPFAVTTGSGTAYLAAFVPAYSSLVAGTRITVKIHAANTGAATINVNNLGAKAILKSNGSALAAGNLKLNSVYTLVYDGTNFILQGEGGEYGTAVASDVLAPKTIGTEAGIVVGTMPNRGAQMITPGQTEQPIQQGYHNGSGKVDPVLFNAAKVLADTTIAGKQGTMVDRAGDTAALSSAISGTTLRLRASEGYRDGVNDFVTITDSDFIAANIRAGVNLFGLLGSLVEGKRYASGTTTSSSTTMNFDKNGVATARYYIEVNGLNFPNGIKAIAIRSPQGNAYEGGFTMFNDEPFDTATGQKVMLYNGFSTVDYYVLNAATIISNTSFRMPVFNQEKLYNWEAWGK